MSDIIQQILFVRRSKKKWINCCLRLVLQGNIKWVYFMWGLLLSDVKIPAMKWQEIWISSMCFCREMLYVKEGAKTVQTWMNETRTTSKSVYDSSEKRTWHRKKEKWTFWCAVNQNTDTISEQCKRELLYKKASMSKPNWIVCKPNKYKPADKDLMNI